MQLLRLGAAHLRLVDESSQASGGLGLIDLDDGSFLGKIRASKNLRLLIELTFDLKRIKVESNVLLRHQSVRHFRADSDRRLAVLTCKLTHDLLQLSPAL